MQTILDSSTTSTGVLRTPSSTPLAFRPMTFRSWTVHFMSLRRRRLNHSAIRDLFKKEMFLLSRFLRVVRGFQKYGLLDRLMHWQLICLVQVRLILLEVLRIKRSTRLGFEPMTSRSWTVHFMSLRQRSIYRGWSMYKVTMGDCHVESS